VAAVRQGAGQEDATRNCSSASDLLNEGNRDPAAQAAGSTPAGCTASCCLCITASTHAPHWGFATLCSQVIEWQQAAPHPSAGWTWSSGTTTADTTSR
jgi:hypothetical protein